MNVVFSLYIPLEQDNVLYRWYDTKCLEKVIEKQKAYAKSVGADYFFFKEFGYYTPNEQFSPYENVNFFKISAMERLSHIYDSVLYLDADVVPLSNENFFERDMSSMHFKEQMVNTSDRPHLRNPTTKWMNTRAMLFNYDLRLSEKHKVINTGIMGGGREAITKLDYFGSHFKNAIELAKEAKEIPGEFDVRTQSLFAFDNESIMSFYYETRKIKPWINLEDKWHFILKEPREIPKDCVFAHCINKSLIDDVAA